MDRSTASTPNICSPAFCAYPRRLRFELRLEVLNPPRSPLLRSHFDPLSNISLMISGHLHRSIGTSPLFTATPRRPSPQSRWLTYSGAASPLRLIVTQICFGEYQCPKSFGINQAIWRADPSRELQDALTNKQNIFDAAMWVFHPSRHDDEDDLSYRTHEALASNGLRAFATSPLETGPSKTSSQWD